MSFVVNNRYRVGAKLNNLPVGNLFSAYDLRRHIEVVIWLLPGARHHVQNNFIKLQVKNTGQYKDKTLLDVGEVDTSKQIFLIYSHFNLKSLDDKLTKSKETRKQRFALIFKI